MGNCKGYSVIELLATVAMISLLLVIGGANLKTINSDSMNAEAQVTGFIKIVRAKALATTSAFTIRPLDRTTLITTYAKDCSAGSPQTNSTLRLQLPNGALLSDATWSLCFTPRGITDHQNLTFELFDLDNQYKTIEVFLGGAVKKI